MPASTVELATVGGIPAVVCATPPHAVDAPEAAGIWAV
jgi:hypothetical protein